MMDDDLCVWSNVLTRIRISWHVCPGDDIFFFFLFFLSFLPSFSNRFLERRSRLGKRSVYPNKVSPGERVEIWDFLHWQISLDRTTWS